jgi:phosphoribosylglycinamide formyltransferase-1
LNEPSADLSAAVLVSGGGSNLQAFIDATASGELPLNLCVVLSNKPTAGGLDRAREAGISVECIAHQDFPERSLFDAALVETLDTYQPDLIILAGFMRILTTTFVDRFAGRIMNIHPSLLPKYPGLDTHQRAIDGGDKWHGCTVHFVTAELDSGAAIIQGRVPVLPEDTAGELAARVLQVEHRIYPQAAAMFAAGRLKYRDGCAWLDGERLLEPVRFTAKQR